MGYFIDTHYNYYYKCRLFTPFNISEFFLIWKIDEVSLKILDGANLRWGTLSIKQIHHL